MCFLLFMPIHTNLFIRLQGTHININVIFNVNHECSMLIHTNMSNLFKNVFQNYDIDDIIWHLI